MKAFLDACVLYPPLMREVLLNIAAAGFYAPLWSDRVVEEWARAAARNHGPGAEALVRARAATMAAAWPDALLDAPPDGVLKLPDPADEHVARAAHAGGAAILVTMNLRDFPARALTPLGLSPQHPDAFLRALAPEDAGAACAAAKAALSDIAKQDPPRTALKKAGLPRFAKWAVAQGL